MDAKQTQVETGHTPEPWGVQHNHRLEIVSTVEPYAGVSWQQPVAQVYRAGVMNGARYRMPAQDNARRIVAAVNACEGLSDAQLEGLDVRRLLHAAQAFVAFYNDVLAVAPEYFERCADAEAAHYLAGEARVAAGGRL